ncbi:MAG: mannose-1-phosphate guanylyltransferase/mannose-6-phosphate isomerase [Alphaproteobacteria bacterium]|nr:mannose-1-phosphate guanylyltransferase/mannose-6-phosphate isomerase [Alphaproteobacteria bacterium]
MSLTPVILCGGSGSRLWPVSRDLHPKPFIRLGDGLSFFQKAYLRAMRMPDVSEIITVTNKAFFARIEGEIAELAQKAASGTCILEPVGRNTAPAVAAAALLAVERDPDAMLLVLAADHVISDQAAFERAVERAKALAVDGMIVTFGISPHAPETGYGYIEAEGNDVLRFVEKPDAQTAREYLETGRFYWNSGMVCFRAEAMIREMQALCPEILDAVRSCLSLSETHKSASDVTCVLDAASFSAVPQNSLDYAVMEKSRRVAVVPCDIGWNDIGCWNMMGDLLEADADGNRVEGQALLHGVSQCHVWSSGRVVGLVGVDNLAIIDTADALLVVNKDRSQDVRHIYARLKASGHDSHIRHRVEDFAWGTSTILEAGEGFDVRRIVIKPGVQHVFQPRPEENRHLAVVSGKGVFSLDAAAPAEKEAMSIPAGSACRIANTGTCALVMIQTQSGIHRRAAETDAPRNNDRDLKVTA